MKILAIDTSSEICSVAILENDTVIAENSLNDGKTHSENLMTIMENILAENETKLNDIDMIACSVGPGSFTGIRIGVSSIKAIAEVLDVPVAAVTSLETLARNIEEKDATIVSLIDAKNDQVYAGIFDENYDKKEEYIADSIYNVVEKIKEYENIIFVGSAAIKYMNLLNENFENVRSAEVNIQTASNVGKIGYKKHKEKDLKSADTIMPMYLRKSQAERMKNEKGA